MGKRLTLGFLTPNSEPPYTVEDRLTLDLEEPGVLDRIHSRGVPMDVAISWPFDHGREVVTKNLYEEPVAWVKASDLATLIRGDLSDKDAGILALLMNLRKATRVVLWWQ